MSRDWESVFRSWSKPPSDTEEQKCQNAERMIREAIKQSEQLKGKTIEIFAQGSYCNNTNVRLDSDVDICVRLMDVIFSDFSNADGFIRDDVGFTDASYKFTQYKNDVETALVAKFGRNSVKRGNKAFDIHENTYRVDADVVACYEHRRYIRRMSDGSFDYRSGAEFHSDNGERIINWPHQHYESGVRKNTATGNRFKFIVRVLKRLRNEMAGDDIAAAKIIPSYLIECLVWNAPNQAFSHDKYIDDVRYVIAHAYNATLTQERCNKWVEINELKYLFRGSQPWTLTQTHEFLGAAWNYIGFN